MSKKTKKLDDRQMNFEFSFEERVSDHLAAKDALLESIGEQKSPHMMGTYEEACVELAAAVKRAVRQYGKTLKGCNPREKLVEEINRYFGASSNSRRQPLSIHMLNHYLSKPAEYPIPGALLFAIQHITGSLEPCRTLADAEGGEVISLEEKQLLMLGKMEAAVLEMNRLKKELRNGIGK